MKKQAREIQYFLFSQYFSDGLRITFGVLLPTLLFSHLGYFQEGITLSLGALCASITDSPGPVTHKRNAMLLTSFTTFLVALVTGFVHFYPYLLGVEILFLCFFFSMFAVYGARAAAMGNAVLVVMILTLDSKLQPLEILGYSSLILAGGLWYSFMSLLFFGILPYRQAQQALGECMHEVARFLRYKSDFYRTGTDLDENYRKIVAQQIVVSEKQDAVREVLFKSRQFIKGNTAQGRILILTFVDLVDLYEQIMATHFDYEALREKFGKTGVLDEIARLISLTAEQINDIGFAFQTSLPPRPAQNLNPQLEKLKDRINAIEDNYKELSNLALKKILVNLRNIAQRLNDMHAYFLADPKETSQKTATGNYSKFVTHQAYDLKLFRNNLNFKSAIFKHAVRVAVVCLFGYIVTRLAPFGHHSYWVLLTILVILKPAFSLTKQRNYQRLVGTIAGGIIGGLVLHFIPNKSGQFVILLVCMVGTYSFQRMNYVVSVLFMTPFLLILFNFLGDGNINIMEERIIDTLIGSAIAFSASYFIFPSWESDQLEKFIKEMLAANQNYLKKLAEVLAGKKVDLEDYKLARKQVYVSSANLSAAFQRMLSEPKRKQHKTKEVNKFIVLNHILSSFIANSASNLLTGINRTYSPELLRLVKRAESVLSKDNKKTEMLEARDQPDLAHYGSEKSVYQLPNPEEELLRSQLEFILKISNDIRKNTDTILA